MIFNFSLKKKIITFFLLFLTIWPPAHYLLANRYNLNHWKFFGLAMYITPTPLVVVEFSDLAGKTFLDTEKIFSRTSRKEFYNFLQHRTHWGRIYRVDKLANNILVTWGGLKGIRVYVHVAKFDSLNARPIIVTDIYKCVRGLECNLYKTKIKR